MSDLLQQLEAWHGTEDKWTVDPLTGELVYEGESVDNDPSWCVSEEDGVYSVQYEMGWYVQAGEAQSVKELLHLMRAMRAANNALETTLLYLEELEEEEERGGVFGS